MTTENTIPLPSKYSALQRLATLGIKTPPTFLLTEECFNSQNYATALSHFMLEQSGAFIVRSAVAAEDDIRRSLAGHFYSSDAVAGDQLETEIQYAFKENQARVKALGLSTPVNLMVQPFYVAERGGVAFTKWQYFDDVYVVAMADSPQAAVAGHDTKSVLIDAQLRIYDGILEALDEPILKSLIKALKNVKAEFGAMDVEWLYTAEEGIVILQMRPITVAPLFLHGASKAQSEEELKRLQSLAPGAWVQNEISENVGALSPLSFSLLKRLYSSVQLSLQDHGFKADDLNWFQQASNGQIFCNALGYKEFYAFKHWWSPVKLSYRKTLAKPEYVKTLAEYKIPEEFSLAHLKFLFQQWLTANLYLSTDTMPASVDAAQFGTYELGHPTSDLHKSAAVNFQSSWAELSFASKVLFFRHLERLKSKLAPTDLYLSWQEFESRSAIDIEAERKFHLLRHSTYFLPSDLQRSAQTRRIYLSANKHLQGTIWNPFQTPNPPENAVYCAEIFDNRFVSLIPQLKGIIVRSGSHLSHSAIVAREHDISYIIDDIDRYSPGSKITLR